MPDLANALQALDAARMAFMSVDRETRKRALPHPAEPLRELIYALDGKWEARRRAYVAAVEKAQASWLDQHPGEQGEDGDPVPSPGSGVLTETQERGRARKQEKRAWGARLQAERERRGWTRAELGRRVGVTKEAVGRAEERGLALGTFRARYERALEEQDAE